MADNQWRTLYQAAVFEVDPEKIEGRAKAAELAINAHVFSDHRIFPEPSAWICNTRYRHWML